MTLWLLIPLVLCTAAACASSHDRLLDRAYRQEVWCSQLQGRVDRAASSYRRAWAGYENDPCEQWFVFSHRLWMRYQHVRRRLDRECRALANMTRRMWPW
jgi:hypothetical protein